MRKFYLVVALIAGLHLGSGALQAQNDPGRIPGSALGSQAQIADKDQQHVTAYIEYWVKQLQAGDAEVAATSRSRLTEPYNQGGTETFINFYDQALASRIGAGMASKAVAGRVCTQIVARFIRHERVADVIKAGLKDPAAAVAYQAAVAAEALAKSPKSGTAVKFGMRAPLVEALKKETSGFVLPYLYGALIAIDDVAGWEAALVKMNERLAVHVASEDAGIDAEFEGLRALYNRLVLIKASGENILKVPDKTLHLFTLVCVRYMDHALSRPNGQVVQQLIDTCDYGSNWAAGWLVERGAKIKIPPRIKDKPELEKKLMISDWRKLLVAEPFKFQMSEVALPTPK